jgi:hypothetical protein
MAVTMAPPAVAMMTMMIAPPPGAVAMAITPPAADLIDRAVVLDNVAHSSHGASGHGIRRGAPSYGKAAHRHYNEREKQFPHGFFSSFPRHLGLDLLSLARSG